MGPRAERSPPGALQSVARTAAVLRALAGHREGLTLSVLAAEVGLPLSSTHRLVAALDEEDLVRWQPRGRIFLGPLVTQIARAGEPVVGGDVHDVMRALARRTQETVDLSLMDGDGIRFVAQCEGEGETALRAVSSVGVRFPLHCTGAGKAFLARMRWTDANALLPRRLPRMTAHTLTQRQALRRELDATWRTGLGYDREEHHLGICSVAAIVADVRATPVAVSLVVPAARFAAREPELVAALRETVAAHAMRARTSA
jgi:DNA-binding IclR family transcriptional regulator